ncbi:MAG: serpin family protein [Planctomycetaceae bacterium]|jgi:serpin B|nr:serpin family protein [Planctomycetaceae bacterium]
MKKQLLIFIALLGMTGCSDQKPRLEKPGRTPQQTQPLSQSRNPPQVPQQPQVNLTPYFQAYTAFALNSYPKVAAMHEGKSFVYSPLSITQELGVLLTGSDADLADKIQKWFSAPVTPPLLSGILRSQTAGSVSFWPFNAVWLQKGYNVVVPYRDNVKAAFGTSVFSADFAGAKEETLKILNCWASDMTSGKVPAILADYPETTRLLFSNILLHKVNWQQPFHPDKTVDQDFTPLAGDKKPRPMMHKNGVFRYFESENLQILVLPYQEENLRLVMLLPKPEKWADLEKIMTPERLLPFFANFKPTPLTLQIPKLTLDTEVNVTALFPELANVSGLKGISFSAPEPLPLGPMLQKTVFKMEEQNAVNTVPPKEPEVTQPEQVKTFAANTPFLFLVWDAQHMTPLLIGRVAD